MTKRTYDLDTAAELLGISKDALRKRIKRGSIEADKDKGGKWRVYVTDARPDKEDEIPDNVQDASRTLLDALRSERDFLRKELERRSEEVYRKDSIIMNLTQKIPQLEASKEKEEEARESRALPWWKAIFRR